MISEKKTTYHKEICQGWLKDDNGSFSPKIPTNEKIQKYLAGEREGFSLVELIIVIAIMAILIGVIALAVLPNINRSKESKDISALDSIASAANAAVAVVQASGKGTIIVGTTSTGVVAPGASADATKEQTKIWQNIYDTVADRAGKCGSNRAVNGAGSTATTVNIVVSYDTSTKKIQAAYSTTVTAAKDDFTNLDATGNAVDCQYLTGQKFIVGGSNS